MLTDAECQRLAEQAPWQHRWRHCYDPFTAVAIWEEAVWPDTREEQIAMQLRLTGEWPYQRGEIIRTIDCYVADIERRGLTPSRLPTPDLLRDKANEPF